jgi:restriction endonuclease Mrr
MKKGECIMNLPKFNETFIPVLEVLNDGKVIRHRELLKRVEDKYYSNLPKELLEKKTKSGDVLIRNRIAWGKSYLKKGDLFITQNVEWFKSPKKVKKLVTKNYN